ncbi:DUF3103 family protein [Pseudoalteromonas fenneropenaei]|uniref:DUF3103 family protein n=1 Tax=Pseudoalteromonas fenneropenaei TaxID=1737459 RepID=A0ABV7CM23_9GAMM
MKTLMAIASTMVVLSSAAQADASLAATSQPSQHQQQVQSNEIANLKSTMARQLATQLPTSGAKWQQAFSSYELKAGLQDLAASTALLPSVQQANQRTRELKGLNSVGADLYQLRLVNAEMLSAWQQGQQPLVAFAPQGDEKHWQYVEAFDSFGNVHLLDVHNVPTQPVLVLEIDAKQSLKEGLAVMQQAFTAARQGQAEFAQPLQTLNDTPISTSVLDRIRLNNDQEPWVLGNAEIYAIVNGVNPSRDEPVLDIVDMPYLDDDGKDYMPNQILIYWDRYRWQAADVLLMEHDDNTNYKTLATTLLDIVAAAMRAIPDPTVQGYALIPQLTNQLIKAMPDHWFSNDDDYVDVFYTLFEGKSYVGRMGASSNAKISLSPLTINPR